MNRSKSDWNVYRLVSHSIQEDLHIAVPVSRDKKDVILKNEPEKLLKTKGKATWIAKNEPENEAEKLLKTRRCGKNESETNRKTKRVILLKIKNNQKCPP